MRVETLLVTERDIMFAIAGQLYSQAPNHQPREADKILMSIRDKFRDIAFADNDWYTARLTKEELRKFIEDGLKSIPEFNNLNLSQNEVDDGIGIDDERPKYMFTSRYSKIPWKSDYIDLDAFTRNVYGVMIHFIDAEKDCFMCGFDRTKRCETCYNNEKYTNKCGSKRELPGGSKATFACKYDCYRHYMICCEECSKRETCEHKCDGDSKTCGNDMGHYPSKPSSGVNAK